jgi:hypothetical protein
VKQDNVRVLLYRRTTGKRTRLPRAPRCAPSQQGEQENVQSKNERL